MSHSAALHPDLAPFVDASKEFVGRRQRPTDLLVGILPASRARALGALLVLGMVLLLAGASLRTVAVGLEAPALYQKDFDQEWLMARAVLDAQNPYQPEYLLAQHYEQVLEPDVQQHAAPHPPLVAVLVAPLGLFPFATATWTWLAIELILVPVAVVALLKSAIGTKVPRRLLLFGVLVFLAWPAMTLELLQGQLSVLLLALISWAWLMYQRRHLKLAGVLLGLAISIKLFPLLLAGYFVARRSWSVLWWAAGTILASTALSWAILGTDAVRSFVTLGLTGAAGWRAAEGNYSIFGAAAHVVEGNPYIPSLISAPALSIPLAALAVVALLVLAWKSWRSSPADIGFALACVLMVVSSPVAWQYYLVLLAYPLVVIAIRLRELAWPAGPRKLAMLGLVLLSAPVGLLLSSLATIFGVQDATGATVSMSAVANIPLLLLVTGPLLLFGVLVHLGRICTADKVLTRAAQANS
jgi:hypothetical protein